MKTIEIDDDLYRHIAAQTQDIGESASDILRRMLNFNADDSVSTLRDSMDNTLISESNHVAQLSQCFAQQSFTEQKKVINRFMTALQILYRYDPQLFKVATESMRGRTRRYFAVDAQTLLTSGNQTKPKKIEGTPYWVITNTNSVRKRNMIEQIMQGMQLPARLIASVCDKVLLKNAQSE